MKYLVLLALISLAGCGPGQALEDPIGDFANYLIGPPDIIGCINRGGTWAWDNVAKRCVQLSPEQHQQLDSANTAAWNDMVQKRWSAEDQIPAPIKACLDANPGFIQSYSGELYELCAGAGWHPPISP